jgi:hypothetical protein
LGSIAELAENADEVSPWDLGGHSDHKVNFRILAAVNANERFREFVERATGEGRTEVADRTVRGLKEVPWRTTRL